MPSVTRFHVSVGFERPYWAPMMGSSQPGVLIVGVAAAETGRSSVLIAGIAGLVAGAMSMAAGEYVSVSSQADTESADLEREKQELAASPEAERAELVRVYEGRGLDAGIAAEVADQMMRKDPIGAHARDELGMSDMSAARPLQAAMASAATFTVGASAPLLAVYLAPASYLPEAVAAVCLVCLASLGALGARAGGAPVIRGVVRVVFWGALAMIVTAGIGRLFGTTVA